jgi:hypothetical protein
VFPPPLVPLPSLAQPTGAVSVKMYAGTAQGASPPLPLDSLALVSLVFVAIELSRVSNAVDVASDVSFLVSDVVLLELVWVDSPAVVCQPDVEATELELAPVTALEVTPLESTALVDTSDAALDREVVSNVEPSFAVLFGEVSFGDVGPVEVLPPSGAGNPGCTPGRGVALPEEHPVPAPRATTSTHADATL